MDKKFVLILKPPGNNDIFFGHHVVRVQGGGPGENKQQWLQKDITFLPIAIIVSVPDDISGHFSIRITIENKFTGIIHYESNGLLYLQTSTTQVEKYGQVPAGKHRKSSERGSSIPTGNFSDFFR